MLLRLETTGNEGTLQDSLLMAQLAFMLSASDTVSEPIILSNEDDAMIIRSAISAVVLLGAVAACAQPATPQEQKLISDLAQPIDCLTARGDLRMLGAEKNYALQRIADGSESIDPAGFVIGDTTQSKEQQLKIATERYHKLIDRKIADIQRICITR